MTRFWIIWNSLDFFEIRIGLSGQRYVVATPPNNYTVIRRIAVNSTTQHDFHFCLHFMYFIIFLNVNTLVSSRLHLHRNIYRCMRRPFLTPLRQSGIRQKGTSVLSPIQRLTIHATCRVSRLPGCTGRGWTLTFFKPFTGWHRSEPVKRVSQHKKLSSPNYLEFTK